MEFDNGRIGNMPITVNDSGVICVSGFSPAIMKSVLCGKVNMMEIIRDTLSIDRYNY